MDKEIRLRKFVGKHYRDNVGQVDYIQIASEKCKPFRIPMIEDVRRLPDGPEKKKAVSSIVSYSKATERHIANLELEMAQIEYNLSKLYERNLILEEEVRRCHAKIDITDNISLSMSDILYKKLQNGK